MNKIPNRQVICDVLLKAAESDRDVVVLCSDSRGSASMSAFAQRFPEQFIEVGIAEQSLVSVSAGLARAGKKVFAASPACFLASRSLEQVKVDVAYSDTNVKLIGISGGISYGALGMTHHSAQDIAAIASIPGMRVYLPSDRVQTEQLLTALLQDQKPAYIRVGRNAVPDVYSENNPFTLNQAGIVAEGRDLAIIACGEMVAPAKLAAEQLLQVGIHARVIDMYCLKPIDESAVLRAARECGGILTVEEHCKIGGLGGMVSQLVCEYCPAKVLSISLPDEPVIAGNSQQVFDYYGLNVRGIYEKAMELKRS